MANTSLSLGKHWETFIKNEVASGRTAQPTRWFVMHCATWKNVKASSML